MCTTTSTAASAVVGVLVCDIFLPLRPASSYYIYACTCSIYIIQRSSSAASLTHTSDIRLYSAHTCVRAYMVSSHDPPLTIPRGNSIIIITITITIITMGNQSLFPCAPAAAAVRVVICALSAGRKNKIKLRRGQVH